MRNRFILFLGAVQVAVGLFIALRPLVGSGAPLTSTRVLDMAFAAFFLIRGIMNLRVSMRALSRVSAPPSPPIS